MKRARPAFLSKAAGCAPVVQSSSQLEIPVGGKEFSKKGPKFSNYQTNRWISSSGHQKSLFICLFDLKPGGKRYETTW